MRAFVSSVITGFEEYRAAARHAVELTNNRPVMAEDFGALSRSPQQACLAGVADSEIYLLLLGERYGELTGNGVAPSEEEFNEARSRRLPILVFVTSSSMEEEQLAFLRRIRGWERGVMYAKFGTPDELKNAVVKALSIPANLGAFGVTPSPSAFDELFALAKSDYDDVVVSMAWIPDSNGARFVPLQQVDSFAESIGTIISETGIIVGAEKHRAERAIEFLVPPDREHVFGYARALDDLRMVLASGLRNETDGFSMNAHYFIDRERLIASVSGMLAAVAEAIEAFDPSGAIRGGWVEFHLKGIKYRVIGEVPSDSTSYTIPTDVGDEVTFPSEPYQLRIPELKDPTTATTLVQALERRVEELRRTRYR